MAGMAGAFAARSLQVFVDASRDLRGGASGGAAAQWRRPWRESGKTTLSAPVSVILILLVGCRRAFDDRALILHLLADNQF
jgi:hypothetical protein